MSKDVNAQLSGIIDSFRIEVIEATEEAANEVATQTVTELKETSPRKSGKYAQTWTKKKLKDGSYVVYNKDNYRLTHLLERGHVIRNKQGTYGRTKAQSHIRQAVEKAKELFPELLKKKIEGGK